jgi:glycosyltransferase involved in cell wall biosynthesis
LRALSQCNIVHWLLPSGYRNFAPLLPNQGHLCTIHHCLKTSDYYPERYDAHQILTGAQSTKDELTRRGFADVRVVHYGIIPDVFFPKDKSQCRAYLSIPDSMPLIGFFGKEKSNPEDRKGVQTLLSAAELVNQERPVGILLSGEGWQQLQHTLKSKGIPVYQRTMANLDQMRLLYGALDLYLCTSRIEGGPVPVLEAMACERPVISTPVGHVPEVIHHQENGLLIPPDDAEATAATVTQLLSDEEYCTQLGRAGRATVLREWTWAKTLVPLEQIYENVATSNPGAHFSTVRKCRAYAKLLALAVLYRAGITA